MATDVQRRLAIREQERARDEAGHRAAWAFIWTLFVFKIATIGIIYYAATSTHSVELSFIYATTWYWLIIPIAGISGPLLYRWRLVRMRRRREQLRNAEWMDQPHTQHGSSELTTVRDLMYEHPQNSA